MPSRTGFGGGSEKQGPGVCCAGFEVTERTPSQPNAGATLDASSDHRTRCRRGLRQRRAQMAGHEHVVFVGHSVSAMIGVLAAAEEPERFGRLVLVGPSPRYIDDEGYVGGFTREDIDGAARVARQQLPRLVERDGAGDHGQPGPPELGEELTNSFCRTDPEIAAHFARVDLPRPTTAPTCRGCARRRSCCSARDDAIAPHAVGEYVHRRAARQRARPARRDRALPEPERARGDDRGDQGVPDAAPS